MKKLAGKWVAKAKNGVVVASTERSFFSKPSRRIVLIVAVFVLIAVLAVVQYRRVHYPASNNWPTVAQKHAEAIQKDKDVLSKQISDLKKQIASEKDAVKKQQKQVRLALLLSEAGNNTEAISVATAANNSAKTADSASVLAGVYMQAHDYKNAAIYYDLAMQRSPKPGSPTERAPYNDYAGLKQQAENMENK